ncbi:MAG TPA: 16S rRNA (guanine(966)-N(2))-methyltransferase RsmD [Terriglobales bacterium]|nr:16S rRNA (guanine(966)-N(2))-methyltransferase RsmD [Terriglobales bacterium]
MRVIAGKFRSRPLRSLRAMDIRPTADKLRETLFNVLTAGNPRALTGSVWLDLYAGTGAVGIEALSRGAAMVFFVESSPSAATLIAQNLRSLELQTGFEILKQEVTRALRKLEREDVRADFVFIDPPYRLQGAYAETLSLLSKSKLLRPETIIVAEHQRKFDLEDDFLPLHRYRKLEQGDSVLSFYRSES